ncbi:B12 binding domain protein [Bacillus sp. THAF10]|uniref:cobalamin B12-binding domain-containing protein n=1 Tax=Bacillus sp. THAF10 TaxID=2587848 RepID=UPI001269022E|nr:cobalamin-dependent protein [Bacillus sp. THAF10]QFT88461.1 B12 binding domain protein [Bacillus sp. THAF10]
MLDTSIKLSEYLLKKDIQKGWDLLNEAINCGHHSAFIYDSLIRDAMYHVGELWQENKINVAEEHLASATCEYLLAMYAQSNLKKQSSDKDTFPRVLLFCIEGEEHNLGLKMASSLFKEFGWDVYDLGDNLPLEYAKYSLQTWKPDVVCLSVSIRHYLPKLKETLHTLKEISPSTTFIVGSRLHDESAFLSCCLPDTLLAKDLDYLYQWLLSYQSQMKEWNRGVMM